MRWATRALVAVGLAAAATGAVWAGEADIVGGSATLNGDGSWTVSATVAHADTGWEHYADRFDVLAPDGTVLAERVLLHPHVNEQPFTRSVRATIPDDVDTITLRAHDSVHGLGGATLEITLER
ncbi:MAG: hypothetical protein KI785_10685 [Devosiaceae bacterium]|nr:hypothetical protein [Devosiaceae bacterium MH13]